ncbi:mitochondrial proton/calcium exchanger protein-like protein isoform X1 [Tanacetum coccineum]
MFKTIPPPPVTNSRNAGNPNMVESIQTDSTNNNGTNNVTQNIVNEDLPQLFDSKGGSYVINFPPFDVDDFTSWKDRFLVYFNNLEPYLLVILENGPYVPKSLASTPENIFIKPQKQWSHDNRRLANQDKRLKSIIISCLPNDVMKSVIKCATAKSMWDDLILSHEEPSNIRDTKIVALRLKFNEFKALKVEYGVSTSIGYGVSNSLSYTAYSSQQINTVYPLPLDTAYRSRHFKTLSLDELRSPDFNLLSDQEYSEEEEEEAMAETMDQYMSKTRTDYGSGVARPKIDNKDQFELKGQFLKDLRENTFSGSDNEDANEHIEKVLKIVDLFHVPNITEVIFFYNGLDIPTRQILDSRGAIPTKTAEDVKEAIQEMAEYSQKWHNKTSRGRIIRLPDGLCYTSTTEQSRKGDQEDVAIRNQGASIKTLEIQIGQMSKVLQERGFGSLPSSTETNPRDQVKSISTTIEADSHSIRRIGSSQYAVSTRQNSTLLYKSRQMMVPFPSRLDNHYCEEEEGNYGPKFMEAYGASHINNTIPQKEKDLGSFTLPCFINDVCFDNALVDLGASVSVMPLSTYLNLGLGKLAHTRLIVELSDRTVKYPKGIAKNVLVEFVMEEKIIFKSIKPASSLIKRVYMLSLRERMELDLEARLMGETLVLNRSLDPFLEDYIELNDLNEPFELRRNQRDDLIPTIKEGEVIEEFRTRDEDLDTGIDDYPCYCDDDKKIHIDYAHNLKFSCMI